MLRLLWLLHKGTLDTMLMRALVTVREQPRLAEPDYLVQDNSMAVT